MVWEKFKFWKKPEAEPRKKGKVKSPWEKPETSEYEPKGWKTRLTHFGSGLLFIFNATFAVFTLFSSFNDLYRFMTLFFAANAWAWVIVYKRSG